MMVSVINTSVVLLLLLAASVNGQIGHIVRFVDRYGIQHSANANSPYNSYFRLFRCPRDGFFRHPTDCQRFFRCVSKHNQQQPIYTIYEFQCPSGLNFDERHSVCNWPNVTPSCQLTSSAQLETGIDFQCQRDGYFRDPYDCKRFYKCEPNDGLLRKFDFQCPFDLVFDVGKQICDWKWLATPPCGDVARMHNVRMAGNDVNNTIATANSSGGQSPIESAINMFTSALNGPTYISQRQIPPNPNINTSSSSSSSSTDAKSGSLNQQMPFSWFKPDYVVFPRIPSLHRFQTPIDQWQQMNLPTKSTNYYRSRPQYIVRPEIPSLHVSFFSHPYYYESVLAQQWANQFKQGKSR
ncbi:hypothetical protein CHUAL_013063 [Chamberlinius hualienensis]